MILVTLMEHLYYLDQSVEPQQDTPPDVYIVTIETCKLATLKIL